MSVVIHNVVLLAVSGWCYIAFSKVMAHRYHQDRVMDGHRLNWEVWSKVQQPERRVAAMEAERLQVCLDRGGVATHADSRSKGTLGPRVPLLLLLLQGLGVRGPSTLQRADEATTGPEPPLPGL